MVHVSARETPTGWEVSVIDNGVGVAPADREAIFQMFNRRGQSAEVDGTGIGLAICKKVVERHHGHIRVESTPGNGTTFYFTLPG